MSTIEQQVGNILLKRGVKLDVSAPLFFRLLGKKKVKHTIVSPTTRTLIKIALISLTIDIDFDKKITHKNATEHMVMYGDVMCKIIAQVMLNGKPKWMLPFIKFRIKNSVPATEIFWLYQLIMLHGGYEDFTNTIKFIKQTRITKPMNLSQKTKRS